MGEIGERVQELVSTITQEKGLELVDVEYKKEGSEYFLRIFIEHPEGIRHHHCQEVSDELSTLLDLYNLIPERYILEVSSPGLERPLKNEKDYHRFQGRKVSIKTYKPIENRKEWQGELIALQEGLVHLRSEEGDQQIPLQQIASARLIVEF